jgi:hypothetical protein
MILALPLVEQGYRKQEAEHKLRFPVNLNVSHGVLHDVVLQRIVSYIGTGHYLFIGLVSKEWQAACAAVGGTPLLRCAHDGHTVAMDYCYYYTTKYSAIFASSTCLRYAHGIGVFPRQKNWLIGLMARTSLSYEKENVIDRDWQLKQVAGKVASIPMLILARELGMSLTSDVLLGAAQSGDIAKVEWLCNEMDCPLPANIMDFAAKSGSIDMITWLQQQNAKFTEKTSTIAAAAGNLQLLEHLHSVGCELTGDARYAAA